MIGKSTPDGDEVSAKIRLHRADVGISIRRVEKSPTIASTSATKLSAHRTRHLDRPRTALDPSLSRSTRNDSDLAPYFRGTRQTKKNSYLKLVAEGIQRLCLAVGYQRRRRRRRRRRRLVSIDSHPSVMSLTGVVIFRVNSTCRRCRVSEGLNAPMTVAPDETARHAVTRRAARSRGGLKTRPYGVARAFPSFFERAWPTLNSSLASYLASCQGVRYYSYVLGHEYNVR